MPHCFCVRQPGKRKLSAQFIEQNRNDWRHRGEVRGGSKITCGLEGERTRHFPTFYQNFRKHIKSRNFCLGEGRIFLHHLSTYSWKDSFQILQKHVPVNLIQGDLSSSHFLLIFRWCRSISLLLINELNK